MIEAYFNGGVIPPKRNWYKNKVLLRYVNEEGSTLIVDLVLFAVSLLLTMIGIAYHIRTALILIPESLIAAVLAGGCIFIAARFLHTVRDAVIILPAVFFPLYAIYNLVSVINTIRKNDIEFYSGEITGKDDKGYFLKGVSAYRFHFIKKMQPDPEPDAGAKVILARFHDSFSLVSP